VNQRETEGSAVRTATAAFTGVCDSHSPRAAAIDEVYLEHAPLMRRIAASRFRIPAAELDALVHDVFATYIANFAGVRGDVRRYLVGGICNAARNFWRSRNAAEAVFSDEEPPESAISRSLSDEVESVQLAAATMARLDQRCREALERYYLHGDDTPTIACALQTSEPNVNYLMHVCRKRARAIYRKLCGRHE
jgi:RNA polymerase sigma factor (sigma-70 family)